MTAPGHPSRAPLRGTVLRFSDAEAVARAAAASFAEHAARAVSRRGQFAVALTGGESPRGVFAALADDSVAASVPWHAVHLFWGDDRCVPPAHPRSNFRPARELLIDRVPIPASNVHRIQGELRPADAAAAYEAELRAFFGPGMPRFDLVHLGLGDDGHVASLFPFDLPRLTERNRSVAASLWLPAGEPRVTLSVPAINAARRVEFLLPHGPTSRAAITAMYGPLDPFRVPAQLVVPRDGELVWFTGD